MSSLLVNSFTYLRIHPLLLRGLVLAFAVFATEQTHGADSPTAPAKQEKAATEQTAISTKKKRAADAPYQPVGDWKPMFDGQTLAGWRINDFYNTGKVEIKDKQVLLGAGTPLTGVSYTNELPKIDYEVSLDAMKIEGSDFFCGLTVPVRESHCSLIVGGWGGGLVGISCVDHMNASENETMTFQTFETNRWYHIRLRVTKEKLEGWIDDQKVINLTTVDRIITMRPGDIESAKPFGIASYQTAAALRDIKIRKVELIK